eukprot:comp21007_c0_seq1/m.28196 comp21007_c0_seq1/g.28196  ORF comp21007_c0_seq1/g.28196 comp21007_c0_seq1/m.28196 type:complete len:538 (-) comp21007_c0_seq1:68-1681(-)
MDLEALPPFTRNASTDPTYYEPMNQAVKHIREARASGKNVSVRKTALQYAVKETTLSQHLATEGQPRPKGRPRVNPVPEKGQPRKKRRANFNKDDPAVEPARFFEWLISPFPVENFFSGHWEAQPLVVQRTDRDYYGGWFSKEDLDRLLRTSVIRYGVNLDVTKVVDGKRQTLTPTGRAYPASVWDFYEDGCSLRLLNPQTFCEPMWRMLSVLQDYFTCGMGVNVYLTPPDSQGFAPHYDDIEAFVLQLEGSKHWRIYRPLEGEELPKYSSRNYSEDEIGEPVMEVVLQAGDMLYFPRGWIHQAAATEEHSLHATVSTYQDNSWGTLFEKLVPRALQDSFEESIEFRKGLPLGYLNYMGVSKADRHEDDPRREAFIEKFQTLWAMMGEMAPLDAAVDQMGVKYLEDSYPPVLSTKEIASSVAAGTVTEGLPLTEQTASSGKDHNIDSNSYVKPTRHNVARIVAGEEGVVVYHSMENARVYHQAEPQKLQFNAEHGETLEAILEATDWVRVEDLPGEDRELVVEVVAALYDACLLLLR